MRYRPSHVIIMGGTNDAYNGSEVSQVINNIQTMVRLALQSGTIPVIGLPIPCNDFDEEILLGLYRENMRQYAVCNGIAYIDFYKVMVDESGINIKAGLHFDGIHPSENGYRSMADVAVEVLAKLINKRC